MVSLSKGVMAPFEASRRNAYKGVRRKDRDRFGASNNPVNCPTRRSLQEDTLFLWCILLGC